MPRVIADGRLCFIASTVPGQYKEADPEQRVKCSTHLPRCRKQQPQSRSHPDKHDRVLLTCSTRLAADEDVIGQTSQASKRGAGDWNEFAGPKVHALTVAQPLNSLEPCVVRWIRC